MKCKDLKELLNDLDEDTDVGVYVLDGNESDEFFSLVKDNDKLLLTFVGK